jgi:indole-3-glycerol phosphate synthase
MISRADSAVLRTGTLLDKIVDHKRQEVETSKRVRSQGEMIALAAHAAPPRPFAEAVSAPGISLIAEIKRASPSKGPLRSDLDPAGLARAYVNGGAAAISVLTDLRFFGGTMQDLQEVRRAVSVPVLRKDFILDPYQLYEARAGGADAVLLIMAILTETGYRDLLVLTQELDMAALVEIHNRSELDRALAAEPPIIGINNRDLRTFRIDLGTTFALRPWIPIGTLVVAESGVQAPADVTRLAEAGVDAALVGTALVISSDPAAAVRRLVDAGSPPMAQQHSMGYGQ